MQWILVTYFGQRIRALPYVACCCCFVADVVFVLFLFFLLLKRLVCFRVGFSIFWYYLLRRFVLINCLWLIQFFQSIYACYSVSKQNANFVNSSSTVKIDWVVQLWVIGIVESVMMSALANNFPSHNRFQTWFIIYLTCPPRFRLEIRNFVPWRRLSRNTVTG